MVEELGERGGAARAEVRVGDERVLLAHLGRVVRVLLGRAGQHGQVRVAQHGAVHVAGLRVVSDGEPHQPRGLGRTGLRHAGLGQRAFGQGRAAFLVLAAVGAVDRVVEPAREQDGVQIQPRVGVPVEV